LSVTRFTQLEVADMVALAQNPLIDVILDVMESLPMIVLVDELAECLGLELAALNAAIDEAADAGMIQRWDECESGRAIVMTPSEVEARDLMPGETGRWHKNKAGLSHGRRHDHGVVRESEIHSGSDDAFTLDLFPSPWPTPLEILIDAEEAASAAPEEPERARKRGPRSDLDALRKMTEVRPRLLPVTIIGEGPVFCGPQPRQVGTEKSWLGRRTDGRGFVTDRGKVEETARIAPYCPGCGGRELTAAEFCVRCSSPSAAAQPSSKARRLREDFDAAAPDRKPSIRVTRKTPEILEVELIGATV
jgi:hypothetical protein